jgi:hypothetical protein
MAVARVRACDTWHAPAAAMRWRRMELSGPGRRRPGGAASADRRLAAGSVRSERTSAGATPATSGSPARNRSRVARNTHLP